ncbi:MAG: hypothetical protein Q8L85_02320 [Alphaproteobacteria bacterium]|nr:hypothetical protein [Alphaproteobacteria bacterium]
MRNFFLTIGLLSCSFSSLATLLDQEQIDQFNATSEGLKISRKFDPEKINTLVIGAGILGSEAHFFGSCCQMGDYRKEYVTSNGEILTEREKKNKHIYKIPRLILDPLNIVHYHFEDGFSFQNKKEALDYQRRNITSPMEVYPENTLFLDVNDRMRDPYTYEVNDYVHLKGDVFTLNELPFGLKVDKIVIEYLGDCLFAGKDFENLDWTWLRNLFGVLNPNGKVFFEMRADSLTSQDAKIVKEPLSDKLEAVESSIAWLVSSPLGKKNRAYFEHMYKCGSEFFEDLSEEEFTILMDYIFPVVVNHSTKILKILREKFEINGFSCVSTKSFPRGSMCIKWHIPNRYYSTVRIEAIASE